MCHIVNKIKGRFQLIALKVMSAIFDRRRRCPVHCQGIRRREFTEARNIFSVPTNHASLNYRGFFSHTCLELFTLHSPILSHWSVFLANTPFFLPNISFCFSVVALTGPLHLDLPIRPSRSSLICCFANL